MNPIKPLCLFLMRSVVPILTALALSNMLMASDQGEGRTVQTGILSTVNTFGTSSLELGEKYAYLSKLIPTSAYSTFGFGISAISAESVEGKGETKQHSLAGWLESSLAPVYEWLKRVRGSNTEVPAVDPAGNTSSNVHLPESPSIKLSQAVSAATERYQGVLMGVKRITIENAIYRIKILRHSGELRTLDYSEEQDKFISEEDESWYANTVD